MTTAPLRVLIATAPGQHSLLEQYLEHISGVQLVRCHPRQLAAHLAETDVVLLDAPATLESADVEHLTAYVRRGGACLGLVGAEGGPLPALFGAQVGTRGPRAELRVRFADASATFARRLPDSFTLTTPLLPLVPRDETSQPLLIASWQSQRLPLALIRSEDDGRVACLSVQEFSDPLMARIVYRLLRHLARREEAKPLGVAVLGYGPSDAVGFRHGRAVEATPGLAFRAACDLNEQRLVQAKHDFPSLRTTTRPRDLADDPEIDIVVVATPPNSHAALATELLAAGKHVVCEKPMCLTRVEAATLREIAVANGRLLTTHQNRRWDADFLAINGAITSGLIGEAFHLEAFVGGFFHPCDYWHSAKAVSGGALYDWGAHYVDSILQLMPGPIATVSSVAHKRVWHDVTNADQERVQIRFVDGREAEFVYSEIAAIRKPKWYILGTEGAIVGQWNAITLREPHRTAVYSEQEVPVTDTPPLLTITRRGVGGELFDQQLPTPAARPHQFHHNLADHLLTGEPLAVPAEQSARVVAVLEAAARSATNGGRSEELEV